MTGVSTPFTSYTIPPSAPDPVADAWRELNRIGILYEDASDDLKDAEQALVAAQAADVQAIVEATNAGEEAKDPQVNERKAQAEIERLQTLKRGLREAADQAGNRLADVIAEHQAEWQASLAETADELAAAYDEAIAEARLALAAFIPAQAGTNWVANFDAGQAQTGRYSQFTGGRVRVSGRRIGIQELRGEHDPVDLLQVAALATASPPSPKAEPPSRRSPKVAA